MEMVGALYHLCQSGRNDSKPYYITKHRQQKREMCWLHWDREAAEAIPPTVAYTTTEMMKGVMSDTVQVQHSALTMV
jgi:membrane peptidoglycan carboxypeptidase